MASRSLRSAGCLTAVVFTLACLVGTPRAQETDPADQTGYKPQTLSKSKAPALQVVDLGQGVSVTQHGRGRLRVVTDHWDFGFVPQDAQVTHRYMLENSGDDTLFIEEVKPTCGCTVASLSKDRLAPGDKVPVEVTLSTKKFNGPLTKQVHVISSDPEDSRLALVFTANVGAAPAVGLESGTAIRFDRVPVDLHHQASLPITNHAAAAVSVRIADPPPAYLKASVSSETVAPRGSVDLVLETGDAVPVGPFNGSVTLELAGAQSTRLTIPITGVGTSK